MQICILAPAIKAENKSAEKRVFLVSAYYSPLPDQDFYMRGSFEADKKLNGNGTNGADGTPVYVGMLAAPRNYAFGTKIYIPDLGVGEVHDRGGAILANKDYDRIDVWMGKGEEGLARALNWGMRLVEGKTYFDDSDANLSLNYQWVNNKLPEATLNRLKGKTLLAPKTFSKPVTNESPEVNIKELQEALRIFGYYDGPTDGKLDNKTKDAILAFQISEGIVKNKDKPGAGEMGPITSKTLKDKSEKFNSKIIKNQNRLKSNIESLSTGLGKKDSGDDVYRMQQMLWELGYYRGILNGKYDSITIDAVYQFQKDNKVIKGESDLGAGYFGKQTHSALVAAMNTRMEKQAEYPKEIQTWAPAETVLPKLEQLTNDIKAEKRNALSFNIKTIAKSDKSIFNRNISLGTRGTDVVELQNILIKEGYLANRLNTGYFGNQTKSALIKFQVAKGIVKKSTDTGAGRVGPGTREILNSKF